MDYVAFYFWVFSLVELILFILVRGWRNLRTWQKWYAAIAFPILPFLVYCNIAFAVAGRVFYDGMSRDEYYTAVTILGLTYFVYGGGIAVGVTLLIDIAGDVRKRRIGAA